jgi:hypothetical protein
MIFSCLFAVHIVTPLAADREVYSEHLAVMKMLAGCRSIVVAAHESPALKNTSVAKAVGLSGCVYLVAKVLCLMFHVKQVW